MKRVLGRLMFAAPFVGIAVMAALSVGALFTLALIAGVVGLVAWFGVAVWLTEQ